MRSSVLISRLPSLGQSLRRLSTIKTSKELETLKESETEQLVKMIEAAKFQKIIKFNTNGYNSVFINIGVEELVNNNKKNALVLFMAKQQGGKEGHGNHWAKWSDLKYFVAGGLGMHLFNIKIGGSKDGGVSSNLTNAA